MQDQFVQLSQGKTRYQDVGPKDGPVVVLVHGMAMSMFVWERVVEPLVASGFRVVRYDLFGRGLSDKPAVVYNLALFEQQWLDLLAHLQISGPIYLVGTSMGGAIATHITATYPERVAKLVLIAPAGFPFRMPWLVKFAQHPRIARWLMKGWGDRILLKSVSRSLVAADREPEFMAEFAKQLREPGFHGAILSSVQNMPLQNMQDTYRRVGKLNIPTLLFWGKRDRILPYSLHEQVRQTIPHAAYIAIDDMGHIPHYEKPESVIPALISFLTSTV